MNHWRFTIANDQAMPCPHRDVAGGICFVADLKHAFVQGVLAVEP